MSDFHKQYAERVAADFAYGDVRRVPCPDCQQRDFVVGREPGRVWWCCFRASCGLRGMSGDARLPQPHRVALLPSIMPYEGRALTPSVADEQYFKARFDLNGVTVQKHIRVTDRDEYLLPYRGPLGNIRGYVLRQPWWAGPPFPPRKGDETAQTKTKLYRHTTEPKMAWYMPAPSWRRQEERVVIVEDQISAMRVAQALQVPCVALMGSGINADGVRDIAALRPLTVMIALDPNAQGNAQQMRVKWGGYWERCRIVALEQDPKDVSYADLENELL
jgi:hypothetical protein